MNFKKLFPLLLLLSLGSIFVGSAKGYPSVEYKDCVKSASEAIRSKGIKANRNDISEYCDCALTKILDKKQNQTESIDFCNDKYIH